MNMNIRAKRSRDIPKKALVAQARSSNPQASVWVSANAGSGKTHVLTERVIRLLLDGTEPGRILCLTYTKAAAAVMKKRIFDKLAAWTRMDDADLSSSLLKLEGKKADVYRLKTARKLFARALETPGGLKIQTIHAFCEALLHQFPLEANIAGHFDMMDDSQKKVLVRQAKQYLLEKAFQENNSDLGRAFGLVLAKVGENGLERLLEEAVRNRQFTGYYSPKPENRREQIFHEIFGLKEEDTTEKLTITLKKTALFPADQCAFFVAHGGKNAFSFVEKLEALTQEKNHTEIRNLCVSAYFSEKGIPRSPANICTKAVQKAVPDALELFIRKQKNVESLVEKLKDIEFVQLNTAAYVLIDTLLGRYVELKSKRHLLDFDDLIDRTLSLLKRKGAGQWVQYKLDQGIDHILVDEAQDTSPAQWEIIRLLSGDFFSGMGQREIRRTVFAVGDEKQSIYSFQGAVPEDFNRNGKYIESQATNAGRMFHKVRLDFSFRSTNDVLSAVDAVFSKPENFEGLSTENIPTVHDPIRFNEPGVVDIWQVLTPDKTEEPEDWRKPVDYLASPAIRLAEKIAETIDTWLKNGEILSGQGRPVGPGDIMILVRQRGQFVHALSRNLKNRGVAVAGADRLCLADHIAIKDLIALGHFALQPYDDLSLAATLKSPLFGIDEQQLFSLAANRPGTLWSALEEAAQNDTESAVLVRKLRTYRATADTTPVFEFYSRVLSGDEGRKKILARLGAEASDVLDAFLDYTLSIQKTGLPGLQVFLQTLTTDNPEIKRELDQNRDEVRIMTVHAAKGLEAAVVFLVDPGSHVWQHTHEPKLLPIHHRKTDMLIWKPNAELKNRITETIIGSLKKRKVQEYRRLLYVGMTRAEDRLILCGYRGKTEVQDTWLPLVSSVLLDKAESIPPPAGGVTAWRYHASGQNLITLEWENTEQKPDPLPALPDFLKTEMQAEPDLPKPLVPSGKNLAFETEITVATGHITGSPVLGNDAPVGPALSDAIGRGNAIHRMLQYLPDIAIEKRHEIADQYLRHTLPGKSSGYYRDILDNVFSVLEDRRCLPLFANNSKSEVPLMGRINIGGTERAISGQIDRLAILDTHILLADFKTGKPPHSPDEIPDVYLLQTGLYIRLLEAVYPGKEIRSMLVYTQGPQLFEPDLKKMNTLVQKLAKNTL